MTAVIGYERDGETLSGTTSTTVELRPESATDETLREVGFLGVTPSTHSATGGPVYTIGQMGHMTVDTVQALGALPGKVWGVAKAIVGVQEREAGQPGQHRRRQPHLRGDRGQRGASTSPRRSSSSPA